MTQEGCLWEADYETKFSMLHVYQGMCWVWMNTCGRVRGRKQNIMLLYSAIASAKPWGALDANDQFKIHCRAEKAKSIHILSISRGMCTPSLSPGITLGKVTLQLKQSMKRADCEVVHWPHSQHLAQKFLVCKGSRWHISDFLTEWSVHHLENNLNKLHYK